MEPIQQNNSQTSTLKTQSDSSSEEDSEEDPYDFILTKRRKIEQLITESIESKNDRIAKTKRNTSNSSKEITEKKQNESPSLKEASLPFKPKEPSPKQKPKKNKVDAPPVELIDLDTFESDLEVIVIDDSPTKISNVCLTPDIPQIQQSTSPDITQTNPISLESTESDIFFKDREIPITFSIIFSKNSLSLFKTKRYKPLKYQLSSKANIVTICDKILKTKRYSIPGHKIRLKIHGTPILDNDTSNSLKLASNQQTLFVDYVPIETNETNEDSVSTQQDSVTIILRGKTNSETIRIRKDQPIGKAIGEFISRFSLTDRTHVSFDGRKLMVDSKETVNTLDIEDGDLIDVIEI